MLKLLSITIWLLTCAPGEELYAHYGHTAIRVQDTEEQIDLCFNYGTFSFDTDHFYWKFVKGETYYSLSVCPTPWFVTEYQIDGRPIYEQELNLTEQEAQALELALIENCREENADYLYNFVYDNCATRPFRIMQEVLHDSLLSHYQGWSGYTYREAIRYYTQPHTIMNGLINMIFGSRANQVMAAEDALFLPEQLMFYVEEAHRQDGTPLVRSSHIAPFQIAKPHWWETIYPYLALFVVLMVTISLWDCYRNKLSIGVDITLGVIYLLVFLLVVFLRFFSIHPLVGFDWRLFILPIIHLCARLVYILR